MATSSGSRVERSCFVCRKRGSKAELTRLVVRSEVGSLRVLADPEQRLSGRGFYLHLTPGCALSKRFFDSFRGVYAKACGARNRNGEAKGHLATVQELTLDPVDALEILEGTLERSDPISELSSGISAGPGSRRTERWRSFRERVFSLRESFETQRNLKAGKGLKDGAGRSGGKVRL